MNDRLTEALARYEKRTGTPFARPAAALFDMDGVLYDSMPNHARAWMMMCRENGLDAREEEFFIYEGRTGASTINILFRRQFGRDASEEEVKRLYGRKSVFFASMPPVNVMPGAERTVKVCMDAGLPRVLVTGSGQGTLLQRLDTDFPGAFPSAMRVTAYDVVRGKPDPEPFLIGMSKAGSAPEHTIAVDNAPLGVTSASRSGAFTIGVRTGPIPEGILAEAGADYEASSMDECAEIISRLL